LRWIFVYLIKRLHVYRGTEVLIHVNGLQS